MNSESEILQRIFDKNNGTVKKHKVNLLDAYLDHFANDSVNKYDRGFSLSSKDVKSILTRNQFQTKLRRLGYNLSLEGYGWGMAIFRYDGKSYIDVVKVTSVTRRFGRVVDVYFDTEDRITIKDSQKDQEVHIQGRFYFDENGKVQKETGYFFTGAWTVREEAIEYDTEEIPVMPFDNNSLRTPDIKSESRNLIKQAGEFVNRIPNEFEKGKTIMAFNNMINSTNNGKDFKDKVIEGGADTFDITDPDGVVANSIAPITVGMSTIEMIQRIYGFYDARARELSFQFRDHGDDTRKSEFDLLVLNQKAFEYMMSKISHRQEQLQAFVELLARIEKIKAGKLTLKISEFEQNRIDNLQAITDLKVAQADQAKGIASKNNAEAKAITDGGASVADPTAVSTDLNMENVETKGV